jgi:hypothetical protein
VIFYIHLLLSCFRRLTMSTWLTFLIGSLLLTLVAAGGLLLHRQNHSSVLEAKRPAEDVRILYVLLWWASLSILAYIVFVFGKR